MMPSAGDRSWLRHVAYEWRVTWSDGRVETLLAHDEAQARRIAARKRARAKKAKIVKVELPAAD